MSDKRNQSLSSTPRVLISLTSYIDYVAGLVQTGTWKQSTDEVWSHFRMYSEPRVHRKEARAAIILWMRRRTFVLGASLN